MAWGLDSVGDLLADLGSNIVDAGADLIDNVDLGDVLAVGTVGASIYFQNEQLKQQEEALERARQDAERDLQVTPPSFADVQAPDISVDIGESDIVTDEDVVADEKERKSNVGKVRKKRITASPKKEGKKLIVNKDANKPEGLKL
jgi:hypothetical protein